MTLNFDFSVLRNNIFEIIKKKKILSIYIIGSGARNELTLLKDENGIIVSDLEMLVIMKSPLPAIKDQKLYCFYYNNEVLCEFIKTHLFFLSKSKTPLTFSFKRSALRIYGPEIRYLLKKGRGFEIHPIEAQKLVYNRVIPFLAELAKDQSKKSINFVYSLCKVYISIAEANLILRNKYSSSYQNLLINLMEINKKNKRILITISAIKLKLNLISFEEFKVPEISQIFKDLHYFLSITKDILINYNHSLFERIFLFIKEYGIKNRFKALFKVPMIQLYLKIFMFIAKCDKNDGFFINNKKTASGFIKEWNSLKY